MAFFPIILNEQFYITSENGILGKELSRNAKESCYMDFSIELLLCVSYASLFLLAVSYYLACNKRSYFYVRAQRIDKQLVTGKHLFEKGRVCRSLHYFSYLQVKKPVKEPANIDEEDPFSSAMNVVFQPRFF